MTGGPQHPVSPGSTLGVHCSALQVTGKAGVQSQGFHSEIRQLWKEAESTEENVYAGQGVGFSKLWAQVGSQRTVAGGSALSPNSGNSTWGPREMTPIKDWDGLGPLSQASYLRFPHLSLPETQGLQAHSAPPRSEALEARRAHRRMGQEGGWGEAPALKSKSTEVGALFQ